MNRIIGGGMAGPPYWKGLKWMGAEQLDRRLRCELSHTLTPIWGNPGLGERRVRSELSHNFPGKTPISTLGEWPGDNLLPDAITIGLSHELT